MAFTYYKLNKTYTLALVLRLAENKSSYVYVLFPTLSVSNTNKAVERLAKKRQLLKLVYTFSLRVLKPRLHKYHMNATVQKCTHLQYYFHKNKNILSFKRYLVKLR